MSRFSPVKGNTSGFGIELGPLLYLFDAFFIGFGPIDVRIALSLG